MSIIISMQAAGYVTEVCLLILYFYPAHLHATLMLPWCFSDSLIADHGPSLLSYHYVEAHRAPTSVHVLHVPPCSEYCRGMRRRCWTACHAPLAAPQCLQSPTHAWAQTGMYE